MKKPAGGWTQTENLLRLPSATWGLNSGRPDARRRRAVASAAQIGSSVFGPRPFSPIR